MVLNCRASSRTPSLTESWSLVGKALLVLEDGRIFTGSSWAATGITFGEAVFSTGMTGYQETLTDPSYHRQVVVMTAPHIGNTGINTPDNESKKIWVAGFVVRNPSAISSNWRSEKDLEVELIDLQTQSFQTQKRLATEMETLTNEIAADKKAKQKEIDDAADLKVKKEIAILGAP